MAIKRSLNQLNITQPISEKKLKTQLQTTLNYSPCAQIIMAREIIYKTPQQIANIRTSGKYLTELLALVRDHALEGVTLNELEAVAEKFIKTNGLKGAFKGYEGFPTNLCLSVNECVVHGCPDETVLKNGDLLKIDA